jgi:molecular chaperone GrpE
VSYRSRLENAFGRSNKPRPPGNQRSDNPAQDPSSEQSAAESPPPPLNDDRAHGSGALADILERLRLLEQQSAEYHLRAAHREAVIDRLHSENQKLRDEARGLIFDPITADLIRLYDGLHRDAGRLAEAGADPGMVKLISSYAEDVELILDRCGLEPFTAVPGESFKLGEHSVAATIETTAQDRENTIAEVTATGFRERVSGLVKRPVRAKFYRLPKASDPSRSD